MHPVVRTEQAVDRAHRRPTRGVGQERRRDDERQNGKGTTGQQMVAHDNRSGIQPPSNDDQVDAVVQSDAGTTASLAAILTIGTPVAVAASGTMRHPGVHFDCSLLAASGGTLHLHQTSFGPIGAVLQTETLHKSRLQFKKVTSP